MVLNQKYQKVKTGHRAYTIMVLNQKNTRKKKLVTEHTL